MAKITIEQNIAIPIQSIIDVLISSGIHRPTDDPERINQMFERADLVISAWDGPLLVGIARSLTDFCYACYLSDLAVRKEYQSRGIGKTLLDATRKAISPASMLLLVAAPEAKGYYEKIGMQSIDRAFLIAREQ